MEQQQNNFNHKRKAEDQMKLVCPFQILGISSNASKADIIAAFKREIIKWHPDKIKENGEDQEEAAKILTRKIIDARNKALARVSASGGSSSSQAGSSSSSFRSWSSPASEQASNFKKQRTEPPQPQFKPVDPSRFYGSGSAGEGSKDGEYNWSQRCSSYSTVFGKSSGAADAQPPPQSRQPQPQPQQQQQEQQQQEQQKEVKQEDANEKLRKAEHRLLRMRQCKETEEFEALSKVLVESKFEDFRKALCETALLLHCNDFANLKPNGSAASVVAASPPPSSLPPNPNPLRSMIKTMEMLTVCQKEVNGLSERLSNAIRPNAALIDEKVMSIRMQKESVYLRAQKIYLRFMQLSLREADECLVIVRRCLDNISGKLKASIHATTVISAQFKASAVEHFASEEEKESYEKERQAVKVKAVNEWKRENSEMMSELSKAQTLEECMRMMTKLTSVADGMKKQTAEQRHKRL